MTCRNLVQRTLSKNIRLKYIQVACCTDAKVTFKNFLQRMSACCTDAKLTSVNESLTYCHREGYWFQASQFYCTTFDKQYIVLFRSRSQKLHFHETRSRGRGRWRRRPSRRASSSPRRGWRSASWLWAPAVGRAAWSSWGWAQPKMWWWWWWWWWSESMLWRMRKCSI